MAYLNTKLCLLNALVSFQVLNYWRQTDSCLNAHTVIGKVLKWQKEGKVDYNVWEKMKQYVVIDNKQLKMLSLTKHTLSPEGKYDITMVVYRLDSHILRFGKRIFRHLEDYNSKNMTDIHKIHFDYCLDIKDVGQFPLTQCLLSKYINNV